MAATNLETIFSKNRAERVERDSQIVLRMLFDLAHVELKISGDFDVPEEIYNRVVSKVLATAGTKKNFSLTEETIRCYAEAIRVEMLFLIESLKSRI